MGIGVRHMQTVFFPKKHEKGSLLNFIKYIKNKVGCQCKECLHYWTNVLSIIQNLCHLKCPEETLSGRGVEASHRGGRDADARVFYSSRKTTFSRPMQCRLRGLGVRPAEHRTSPAPGTDLVPGWKPLRSRAQRQQRGWVALCSGDSVLGQYGPERRAVPCHWALGRGQSGAGGGRAGGMESNYLRQPSHWECVDTAMHSV